MCWCDGRGNTFWLIGVLLRTPEVQQKQEAASRGLFLQQHVQEFVAQTRQGLTDDLDLLIRTIQDQRSISYRESIARANRLMQLASTGGACSGQLLQLQQSYDILHTVALLAFKPIPAANRVDADARPSLHVPAAIIDLLSSLIHCIFHVDADSAARQRLLEACGDDAQHVMYGLQRVSFCQISEVHRQTECSLGP
jgi:hypothetical protein